VIAVAVVACSREGKCKEATKKGRRTKEMANESGSNT
jgi:hypothetical protein